MINIRQYAHFEHDTAIRRLIAIAYAVVAFLFFQGMTSASAQVQTASSWQSEITELAGSNDQLSTITIPSDILVGVQGSATWNVSRAGLMLFAADVARHNQFSVRSGQLLQEAEKNLLAAWQTGLSGVQGGQCAYLLGYLAERYDNNLPSAASYYQQAVSLDSANALAANALARVQLYLARTGGL